MSKGLELKFVNNFLIKNGFTEIEENSFIKDDRIKVVIKEDHYTVSHYEEAFEEWLIWFSHDLVIYSLIGYLTWNNFIDKDYKI